MIPFQISWILDNFLAVSTTPSQPYHAELIKNESITHVINLKEEEYSSDLKASFDGIKIYHIPIRDFSVPDEDQIDSFIKLLNNIQENGDKVLVHCFAGCGRTGTMVTLFLIEHFTKLSFEEIFQYLKKRRPCALETPEQVELVKNYYTKYRS
jgi:atypical dual specificity phosphatase